MKDVSEKIMPGLTHEHHPKYFAYYTSGVSFPGTLGDILASGLSVGVFNWINCPAGTELENIVMDWFAKALGLPKYFISDSPGSVGGGVLQNSASECIFISLLVARAHVIEQLKGDSDLHDSVFLPKLVAYTSEDAHYSMEKAAKMSLTRIRLIKTDSRGKMRVDVFKEAVLNDINNGLIPFFVMATLGTTGSAAYDNVYEIGKFSKTIPYMWFHIDGAYGANAFILPEMRRFGEGMEYADSMNVNACKMLLVNFESSAMWVKDVMIMKKALSANPVYLQHDNENKVSAIDYRNYGISLTRRMRSAKFWFVFRTYGLVGLQNHVRKLLILAKKFEKLVLDDDRFEVVNEVHLGLVCFRLKHSDDKTEKLLNIITNSRKMFMVPARLNDKFVIRYCVMYEYTEERHIIESWKVITEVATHILGQSGCTNGSLNGHP
ncbi:Tdc1.2 family protein [Megaselia abdita]